jgi:hypothetical protein
VSRSLDVLIDSPVWRTLGGLGEDFGGVLSDSRTVGEVGLGGSTIIGVGSAADVDGSGRVW